MNPNQPQPGQPQTPPQNGGYPPQPGAAQTGAQNQPNQYVQPQSYSTAAPQNPYAQTPPQQQQAPANWYTPAPKPTDSKPSSVDDYLQSSRPQTQDPAAGQTINGQYAVDYLGGIAPSAPSNTISIAGFSLTKKMLAIIGGGMAALTLAMVLIFAQPPAEGPTTLDESSLYASYIDTQDILSSSDTSTKHLSSSQLRSFNGSFQAFLTNSASQMEEPLTDSGIDPNPLKSAAKKPPYHDEDMAHNLNEARLLDTYDRVYAREVDFKMQTMHATIQRIRQSNSRESMQEYLNSTQESLETLQEALENYLNSSS